MSNEWIIFWEIFHEWRRRRRRNASRSGSFSNGVTNRRWRGGEIASSSYFFITLPPKTERFSSFLSLYRVEAKKSTRVLAGWLECIRHWLCSFGLINVIFFFSSIFTALCGDRKLRIWNAHFKIKQPIEVILGWPTLFNKKKVEHCRQTNFVRLSAICWHEFRGRFVDIFCCSCSCEDNIYVIKRCDKKVDIVGEVILSNRRSNCVSECVYVLLMEIRKVVGGKAKWKSLINELICSVFLITF